jgi:hypothetical protein
MGKSAEPLKAPADSNAENYITAGIEHDGMGHWDVTKNHVLEAEKADPQSAEAHSIIAQVLGRTGDHAGATAHFKRGPGAGKEQCLHSELGHSEEARKDVG